MKIQYASDLHLEFPDNRRFFDKGRLDVVGDILILGGDVMLLNEVDSDYNQRFLDWCSENFEFTYWIPGNHEYYGSDIGGDPSFYQIIRPNVFFLNNQVVANEDLILIFSTMWTNISPMKRFAVQNGMNDFEQIQYRGRNYNPDDWNYIHDQSKKFLEESLKLVGKKVVVTHHVPTFMNYPEQFKNSTINEGFAVELFPLIEETQPDAWLYGHTHGNTPEFQIGKTRMLTNQMGYITPMQLRYGHERFSKNSIIEI